MRYLSSAVLAIGLLAIPLRAVAVCQTGEPVSYDSIHAVMLTSGYRTQDGYHANWPGSDKFSYSSYWVLFTNLWTPMAQYSQYDLEGEVGTYTLQATLSDAVAVLRKDNFYQLQNPFYEVTDTPQLVLSVLNCSTVTRIIVYRSPRFQAPTVTKLFDDLESLIVQSSKTPTSATPTNFKETLIFDP